MLKRGRPLNRRGDTIVEVMIVLAVLGLALGISYSTANKSLLDARQAEENAYAAELVQSQVEELRILASNDPTSPDYIFLPAAKQPFCINTTNDVANSCQIDNLYNITITYTPANPVIFSTGGTFIVTATWPDVEGQGNDTVTLVYRYYQPQS